MQYEDNSDHHKKSYQYNQHTNQNIECAVDPITITAHKRGSSLFIVGTTRRINLDDEFDGAAFSWLSAP